MYTLDVVQTVVITELGFRIFVTSLGNAQVFNRVETACLIPIFTAIGELSRAEHERLVSNILPRHILCPGILCTSDPHFGTIEESGGSNYYCKFLKEV